MEHHNSTTRRTQVLSRHLTNAQTQSKSSKVPNWMSSGGEALNAAEANAKLELFINGLPSDLENLDYNIADHLDGPFQDKERFPRGWIDVWLDFRKFQMTGENHVRIVDYQKRYGTNGLASNIVIPSLRFGRDGPSDSGARSLPHVSQEVIIANPDDAQRIARIHVKKQGNLTPMFFNSIISTTDKEDWQQQREHLVTAFMPRASLQQIFPVTLNRAQHCAERLDELRKHENKDGSVNINDFLLYETEAQLQLALFGMNNEFMEDTNEKFRNSMAGAIEPMYARKFCDRLIDEIHDEKNEFVEPVAVPPMGKCPVMHNKPAGGCPVVHQQSASGCPMVKGPLSARLKTGNFSAKAEKGNAFIFAFAGHDTTGHTLTWLVLELCRNPDIQRRLHGEVDQFFERLNGREMTYNDLMELPFMTKCIMETLRLWPAVANGTFREIQFDDTIAGPNGTEVKLPKGTPCRIVNWSRHRNPDLWGSDADKFNPDREWQGDELWNGDVLRAYNPATGRFSPFTFPPRDCIGKNFSHMEMRAIMLHLLRDFSFKLSKDAENIDTDKFFGVNYGTMGPQDITQPDMVKAIPGWGPASRKPMGLRVVPVRRHK